MQKQCFVTRKQCFCMKAALSGQSGNNDLGNERKAIKNGGLNKVSEG